MGKLWDIVQGHIDASPYPPSERQVATKLGISPTALSNWRAPKRLPGVENLRALARLAGVPYSEVLEAALLDTGYTEEVGSDARSAPMKEAGSRPADRATLTNQSDVADVRTLDGDLVDPDDHALAARDADDDAEAEAQQEEA